MNGFSRMFRGGFDEFGHFVGGEWHADDCECGECEGEQPTITFDHEPQLAQLLDLMMWANNTPHMADQLGVYGGIRKAIVSMLSEQFGSMLTPQQISGDWNLGGNENFLEDVRVFISTQLELANA